MRSIRTSIAVTVVGLTGCVSMPDYAHYGEAAEHYAEADRYRAVSFSIDASAVATITSDGLARQLGSYLSRYGIEVATDRGSSEAHFELVVRNVSQGTSSAVASGGVYTRGTAHRYPVSIKVREIAGGEPVGDTELYYVAWSPDRTVREQQLASMIVDDLLLIWHPRSSAAWLTRKSNSPAPFALIQDAVEPQVGSGQTRLSWERFPSARILEGTALAPADFSSVTYEVRIQHVELREFAFSLYPAYTQAEVFVQGGITEPHFTVPFVMPSCDNMIWSVRAHFILNGHRRVTEWAGSYYTSIGMVATTVMSKSTLPPHIYRRAQDNKAWKSFAGNDELMHHSRIGTISEVVPPTGIKCRELDWGILRSASRRAEGAFDQLLEPLGPGDSIGLRATIDRQCHTEKCEFQTGKENISRELSTCLKKEFGKRNLRAPVVDVSDEDTAQPAVRYVLDTQIRIAEGRPSRNIESGIIMTATGKNSRYSASFDANLIDTSTGDVVGSINSEHRGDTGGFTMFLFIVPVFHVPYGSAAAVRDKACDELARYASFVLRGGIASPWPDEHFRTEADRLW